MKKKMYTLSPDYPGAFARSFFRPDMMLLDIETTGLSPANNFIYCIGCSFLTPENISLCLLFAERQSDEPELLKQLSALLAGHSPVITFNGTTFDIPFLKKRYAYYHMEHPFSGTDFIDLYREARQLKPLLRLNSYKQKSLEQFLGCSREDTYSGGELIRVYTGYIKNPSPESLHLLFTHNYEDVKGMYDLLELLSYRRFLDGNFAIRDIAFERDGENLFINFILALESPLPQSIRLLTEDAKLLLGQDSALIQFPVRFGKLRHYFPDYKNYYYLPEEGSIVHKSVGAYVDAGHRQKATRENCFIEKECFYLAVDAPDASCELKTDYSDRHSYMELPCSLKEQPAADIIIPKEQYAKFYDFLLLFLQTL